MYSDINALSHNIQISDKNAISIRNNSWVNNPLIPKWVDINSVELDQFFTRPDIAQGCFDNLIQQMKDYGIDHNNYKFVEPSAGLGAFYDLLPKDRRIGIDVEAFNKEYVRGDFLGWRPKTNGYRYACVGNPPFGYRAWLALAFLNHAAEFSDFVGFIVPMAFQSRGKSNVQDRVKHLSLIYSSLLPADSFIDFNRKPLKVNALWQVWAKIDEKEKIIEKTCNSFIDLFTVDMRKERLCGQKRMHEANFFLQRTFYTDPPGLVKHFEQVKYVCGYGIVIKKDHDKVIKALNSADWKKHSNLASHNCRHISMCHIRSVLIENGLIDNV